jgi:hypothetical protein
MDKGVMSVLVERFLMPFVATAPDQVILILILDSYRCHMMVSVVFKIQELGVEVKHIPGRCNSFASLSTLGLRSPFRTASSNSGRI